MPAPTAPVPFAVPPPSPGSGPRDRPHAPALVAAAPGGNQKPLQDRGSGDAHGRADAPAASSSIPHQRGDRSTVDHVRFDPGRDSFTRSGSGRADLYVNHETSLVPFPIPLTDYTNSHVDRLVMNQNSAGILSGRDAIPSSANYQRFCSNFLAGPAEGFDRQILFTNEEATDVVNRQGLAWPAIRASFARAGRGGRGARTSRARVPDDLRHGPPQPREQCRDPRLRRTVVLSGDDTFSARPRRSTRTSRRIRMLSGTTRASSGRSSARRGSTITAISRSRRHHGHFIPVRVRSQSETRRRSRPGRTPTTCSSSSGRGHRLRPQRPHVVYMADTGEPRAVPIRNRSPRRAAGGTNGPFPNGRISGSSSTTPIRRRSTASRSDRRRRRRLRQRVCHHQPDNSRPRPAALIQEDRAANQTPQRRATRPSRVRPTPGSGATTLRPATSSRS